MPTHASEEGDAPRRCFGERETLPWKTTLETMKVDSELTHIRATKSPEPAYAFTFFSYFIRTH